PAPSSRAVGSVRMAERLEQLASKSDPAQNPFLNRQRAEGLRKRLTDGRPDPAAEFDLRLELALELLRAGDATAATQELARIQAVLPGLPPEKREESAWLVARFTGQAYLRLGEQENCIAMHTSESCLVPIGQGGMHEDQTGSRTAISYFTRTLSSRPEDLETVWLLNLAYMTLNEYPDKVPRPWLIPPRVFQSDYELPRFKDVAGDVGLAIRGRAGGAIMEDFDNDGWLDVMKSSWGLRDPLQFFHNNGDGTFTEKTKEAGLEGIVGGLNLVQADYNNDGYRDVLVLRGAWLGAQGRLPNSLLRNNGNGTFTDVTEEAGLLSFYPTQTAVWFDYDGDGWLDLFIGNESSPVQRSPCELYHNNHDGTFTENAAACGAAYVGFVKGVACGDYDHDGRPDLYLSCFQEPNVLLRNAGPQAGSSAGRAPPWKFVDMTSVAGVAEPIDSFPAWFFDYDNDGWLDLFVASYSWENSMTKVAADYLGLADNPGERPRLYHNQGDGTFRDVTKAMHLDRVLVVMGANFGDLDNDGWPDLYLGTGDPVLSSLMPNRMFRNAEGKLFQDVTTAGGFGHVQKGHGIAFGDIDNDGDQDIFAVLGGAYEGDTFQSALFENPGNSHHWLTLVLRGVKSNRDALGAEAEIEVLQNGNRRHIYATVSTGGSFGGNSLQQEIGLGDAQAIGYVTVRWPLPGRPAQIVTNVPMDVAVRIEENRSGFELLARKRFRLGANASDVSHK
ncbi:MAG TPA: CRTAC1 family protein, partial [Verrucomicrobiae bacterium]|nr:CRTAC1 family protein [Verrucomicrobiae bacterium]